MLKKISRISLALIILLLMFILYPLHVMAAPARIGNDHVFVRSSPSRANQDNVLFQVSYGEAVEIVVASGEFYRVHIGTHRNVYVFREFVYRDVSEQGVVGSGGATFFAVARHDVRERNAQANILGTLAENTRVDITGQSVFFYRVTHNNRTGYVERTRVNVGAEVVTPTPTPTPAPHTHTPGNWVTTRDATCTVAGHRERRCTVCNDVVTSEAIPALGHVLSGNWIVRREPTCAEEGYQVQYCTRINEPVLNEAIPLLAHTPTGEWLVVTEPTCAREGEEIMYCEICGNVAETRSIQRLSHTPSGNWIVYEEPTCNTPGRHVQYCVICGSIAIDEVIPAITGLDHVFSRERISGNIFVPPIVTDNVCGVCGYYGGRNTSFAFVWVSPLIVAGIGVTAFLVFKQKKRGKKFVCPYCVNECYTGAVKAKDMQCPNCGTAIPSTILDTENLPFSIIGVAGSGKSAYITVMLHELKRSAGLKLSLSHLDRNTLAHQNTNYKSLYEDRMPVPATAGGDPMPQVWSIRNLAKKSNLNSRVPTYSFTIFDGAGEHTQMIDVDSAVARYMNMSEAIIFVLDPLTISSVRNDGLVDENVMNKSLGGGGGEISFAEDVVNDIANYIRAMNPKKYATAATIDIPVAVVMTKFDTVWNHPSFGENALVKNPSLTIIDDKIKSEEIDEVHTEVEDWLEAIEERGLLMSLKANFPNHKFFGVSSYGQPPKDDGTLNKPNPHRVLDPILWLFKNKDFID